MLPEQSMILSQCNDYDDDLEDIGEGMENARQSQRIKAAVSDYLAQSFRRQKDQQQHFNELQKSALDSVLKQITIN